MNRLKIDLEKLRTIGWEQWDPIGLHTFKNEDGEAWPEDEYDTYLMQAAGMFANGKSVEEVANYLYMIEKEHMGLGESADAHARTHIVSKAIASLQRF